MIWKVSGAYLDQARAQNLASPPCTHIVANLKIDAIYALYLESFCEPNLAIRKVFAFSDSDHQAMEHKKEVGLAHRVQHLLVPGLQKQRLANID